jgi:hypothetical protein
MPGHRPCGTLIHSALNSLQFEFVSSFVFRISDLTPACSEAER